LGEVPERWEVRRARAIGAFTASGIDKKIVEGEKPVKMFNYLDVYQSTDKTLRYSTDLMDTTAPQDKVTEHSVRNGDILLTPSSETADDIGHAARVLDVPTGVVYSYHQLRFRTNNIANPAFLTYCFNSAPMRSYFSSVCTGTTRMVLGRDDFKNAPLAIPTLTEQAIIAAFLDRETAKIDALVAEQRRLIDLLKEKRQAVISHVVTKGLNPHAPMKPSGVTWLGDVPEHWRVLRLKRVSPRISGRLVYQPAQYFVAEGVPFLMGNNVTERGVNWEDVRFVPEEVNRQFSQHALRESDVITVRVGAPGLTCVVPKEADGLNCGSLMIIRRSASFDSQWLSGVMNGFIVRSQIDLVQYGAAQEQINITDAVDFLIPTPPLVEQSAIAAFLNDKTAQFDALSGEAQRSIDLLQERRNALISAAVTGKIDVRGLLEIEAA
jgi:type I restriction enzyme S subunit